ncbi:MAG: hypothetical protein WC796_01435 [Candidatus Pacearchaeota archaeon]|jgi:hypothetical protein
MKLIGFNFSKISIEKYKEFANSEETEPIKTNIQVTDVKKDQLEFFKNQDIFSFKYIFKILYEPHIAELTFTGSIVLLIPEEEIVKDLEKQWKDKLVPQELKFTLINLILSKCNLKALQLEEDLNLPHHIPLPQISPQTQDMQDNQDMQEKPKRKKNRRQH